MSVKIILCLTLGNLASPLLYFQTALPWPSTVPVPVTSKPLMFSNEIQKSSSYMLGSVTAFRVPAI